MITNEMSPTCLRLSPHDNVLIVIQLGGVKKGDSIYLEGRNLSCATAVDRGHKIAISFIPKGEKVRKFGCVIGLATQDINPGEHVHVHNVAVPPSENTTNAINQLPINLDAIPSDLPSHFFGFPRSVGLAGVRNYVVVVASVNCSATVTKAICRHFWRSPLLGRGVDGVIPVVDPAGCTQEIGGEYHRLLNRTIAGWIAHPNVVGALVIGLGCEGTTPKSLGAALKTRQRADLTYEHLTIQEVGGTANAIREGIRRVEKILTALPSYKREELPVSQLRIALNCGGSDAFSAITANPALGFCSDILISKSGSVVLAEIPECHGAEQLLYDRTTDPAVRTKLAQVFDWWKAYSQRQNVPLNTNLALGNIQGGISTIIEKSIGATSKAGSSRLVEVIDFAEAVTKKGFALMNTPGYDPVSVTGLVAGGCNLVAFTTGRGSVYGCSIAPTVKISTTTELFNRMRGDMDFDAGPVLNGASLSDTGASLFKKLIQVASGEHTNSEELGLGWEEFIPWAVGETL